MMWCLNMYIRFFERHNQNMRTKHFLSTAIAATLLAMTFSSHAQQADSVIASIFDAQGRIAVKTKSSRRWENNPKNWSLCEGDSVKVIQKASATILYRNGHEERLDQSKSSHRVTRNILKSNSEKISTILSWLLGQEKPLPQGKSRGAGEPPVLIYPRYGKMLSTQPPFAWLSSAPGTEYHLQLFNANDNLVWQTTIKDTMVNFPSSASKLMPGAFYQVELKRLNKNSVEDYGNFVIAATEENAAMTALRQDIQKTFKVSGPNDVTADMVYAAALMKDEFFTEALLVLQNALKKQPRNQTLRTMLAQIYDQVGPPVLIKSTLP